MLGRLRQTWRLACGDTPEPSTVVIDNRTCPSAPTCFARSVDGGKKIRGIKIHLGVEKHGIPLPPNEHMIERTKEHLLAFVQIASVSILSRRIKRLTPQAVGA